MPHHHHDHHFDPQRFRAFEDARRSILPPERILADLSLDPAAVLADIGAGTGFLSLPAANVLPQGRVLAVDRQQDMLDMIEERAREQGLTNIETIQADAAALPLADGSVHAVLMSNVFHDIDAQDDMLSEVRRILRPGGTYYLVEWDTIKTSMGPPLEIRIAPEDLSSRLTDAGFTVDQVVREPEPFYRLIARRP